MCVLVAYVDGADDGECVCMCVCDQRVGDADKEGEGESVRGVKRGRP